MKCLVLLAVVASASAGAATLTPWALSCVATCDSLSTAPCAYANLTTTIPIGTTLKVQLNTTITCSTGSYGAVSQSLTCANGTSIDQVCIGSSSANVTSFTNSTQLLAYLNANGIPYASPGAYCNAVCTSGTLPASCISPSYQCSLCFANGCLASSRGDEVSLREERANSAQVYVALATGLTIAQQTAAFRSAACAGLFPRSITTTCLYRNGASTVLISQACPTCSHSKKGLLGLLGLLALIPCLALISLSSLLLLCLVRRKKTAAAVPFATFDPGLPPVAATYPQLAPTYPVVY